MSLLLPGGTVSSVNGTGANGITVTGGPITSSGTLAVGVNASDLRTTLNVADGAEANVQPDWNATSGDAAILNKPTVPSGNIVDDTSPQLGGK